jgi:hypothetical protein
MKSPIVTAIARAFLTLVRLAHRSRLAALAAGLLALMFAPWLMQRVKAGRPVSPDRQRRSRVIDGEYRRMRD